MRLLVTANQVPFISGGSNYHVDNLTAQLRQRGHQVELLTFPFDAASPTAITEQMQHCQQFHCDSLNGITIDKVISLQFPSYAVQHPNHAIWVMHQHRTAYELYQSEQATAAEQQLKQHIEAFDNQVLGDCSQRFANSCRVAERLQQYNGLVAKPLYHPPNDAEHFYCAESWGYVYCPSRLENLKRQQLLIEAARYLQTPAKILIAGAGPRAEYYQGLIEQYELEDNVRLLGRVSEAEKLAGYAHAMAVFFGPYDEDYGYITLEAMLSAKPVITCKDSGGPLEFVVDEETGFVVDADPRQIAAKIDWLWQHQARAVAMGRAGQDHYQQQQISWGHVVETLLAGDE